MANIRVKFRQKLGHVITVLKTTNDRVGEAERHIAYMEERILDFKETLNQSLQTQEILQMKLTDPKSYLCITMSIYMAYRGSEGKIPTNIPKILNRSWSFTESNFEYNNARSLKVLF